MQHIKVLERSTRYKLSVSRSNFFLADRAPHQDDHPFLDTQLRIDGKTERQFGLASRQRTIFDLPLLTFLPFDVSHRINHFIRMQTNFVFSDIAGLRLAFRWRKAAFTCLMTGLTIGLCLPAAAHVSNAVNANTLSQPQQALTAPLVPVRSSDEAELDDQAPSPPFASLSRDEKLDKLFADLRKTADEAKAVRIAAQINSLWSQSESATVDLLMLWANTAIIEKKYPVAIDFLDEAVALKPDYAEVWNRRATLHFLMKDYARAMFDINQTLQLEPRHYGALTGMAAILEERGLKQSALQAYERALAVYPMLREAQKKLDQLSDELTDTRL